MCARQLEINCAKFADIKNASIIAETANGRIAQGTRLASPRTPTSAHRASLPNQTNKTNSRTPKARAKTKTLSHPGLTAAIASNRRDRCANENSI